MKRIVFMVCISLSLMACNEQNNQMASSSKGDNATKIELVQAVKKGNLSIVQTLLSEGVDANTYDYDYDGSVLAIAILENHIEIVKILLDNGADVEKGGGSLSIWEEVRPIHIAAQKGNIEIVKLLLEKNAKVNIHNLIGTTPLMKAVEYNHIEVARLLLDNGAEVNAKTQEYDTTALILAAQKGYGDIVRMFLENGADVNIKSQKYVVNTSISGGIYGYGCRPIGEKDYTALKAAKENGHAGIVQLLEKAGAKE